MEPTMTAAASEPSHRLHGQELEIDVLAPTEIERAVQTFLRDGFVAVRDALDPAQLRRMQASAARVMAGAIIPGSSATRSYSVRLMRGNGEFPDPFRGD